MACTCLRACGGTRTGCQYTAEAWKRTRAHRFMRAWCHEFVVVRVSVERASAEGEDTLALEPGMHVGMA